MLTLNKIRCTLVNNWKKAIFALKKLKPFAEVRPDDGWIVFENYHIEEDHVAFDLKPIVFNVPERYSHTTANLYIVIRGKLSIDRNDSDGGPLATHSFASEIGYFVQRGNGIKHLYGAHYDFVLEDSRHPVFHAQLKSFCQMFEFVQSQFNIQGEPEDLVKGMLSGVRVPCAQMDIFSVFLQICADHLMGSDVGPEDSRAFDELLKINEFLRGAGSQVDRLASGAAVSCYRSLHWYPTETA